MTFTRGNAARHPDEPARRHPLILALIISSTVLGIAGTDLVLPAVPSLPGLLGGSVSEAQFVLAAFTAGGAGGLLAFAELGARLDQRLLLVASLLAYGAISWLCCFSTSLPELIWLRFLQGGAGSAAAVFAPGLLRSLYGDARAVGALGFLGSVEALTPAFAPIAGVWLLSAFGWKTSFEVIAALAWILALMVWRARAQLPGSTIQRGLGGYGRLFRKRLFLGQAFSHAFVVAALLVFVFGAPTVITTALHARLQDFIVMQMSGISLFILAANLTGSLSRRFGVAAMIMTGTMITALGGAAMFLYAILGGKNVTLVTLMFLPVNMGLGLRGPPGFHAALVATGGGDARGAVFTLKAAVDGGAAAGGGREGSARPV